MAHSTADLLRSLRACEASYAAIQARPTAYPWRPSTIPAATKTRKLRKLAKDIAGIREQLAAADRP
jgi:hypothetical protein